MSFHCEVIVDPGLKYPFRERLGDFVAYSASTECNDGEPSWHLSLRLATDETIALLHREFFDDPTPTDVITFPSGDDVQGDERYLGDIIVSIETAAFQAIDAGHSSEREVAFLAVHGLLHLCGYDDLSQHDRDLMLRRQYELLESWEREHGRPW